MKKLILLGLLCLPVLAACSPADNADTADTAGTSGTVDTADTTGTAGTTAGDATTVAFVTNNPSDFWMIAKAGTAKAAAELGCTVEFKMPQTGTALEQQQIVENLLTRGVDGIAISPVDPANQTDMLNEAASRVPLVTQDSDAPQSDRVCYIGTNNYDAGRAAADLIKQVLPQGGEIMLFVGSLDAQNAVDRKKGIEDNLQGTHIAILDTRTDQVDQMKAIANAQDALTTHPELDCLVGLWAYNGPAILSAVRDSGKLGQVSIVCFDEQDETLQGVKDGHIYGTIVQQPFEFGYQSVKLLHQLAQGDTSAVPENKTIYVPVKTITPENVDAFWTQLKEQVGRS